jgi:hypothetical protein
MVLLSDGRATSCALVYTLIASELLVQLHAVVPAVGRGLSRGLRAAGITSGTPAAGVRLRSLVVTGMYCT